MTAAQIEQIARLYCRKLGLDPDANVPFSDRPRWQQYTTDIRRKCAEIAMSDAIAEVRATVTEG
jgi:hypothetical protein